MPLHIEAQLAVAKINKYATAESGDTVEVVERPRGGVSLVMADGQRSGRSAKAISNIVVRKAISLLAEGVRDGAVARATHDYLHLERGGKVSAELTIISVDLVTSTLVISRNARCPHQDRNAQSVADTILAETLRLDQNRPHDDAAVVVLKLLAQPQPETIRRLFMRFPI